MKKLNLYCPVNTTGYGLASLNIIKALYQKSNDIDLTLTTIGGIDIENQNDVPIIKDLIEKQDSINPNNNCLKIWHQFDLATKIGNGYYYAYPFFEIDTFNKKEKTHLNIADELLVSSNWAKNILLDNKINKPINIVPLGVDTNIFNSSINRSDQYDKYVFITIGKWEIRKSHDLVIKLFNTAFEKEHNVELWMITHNPFLSEAETKNWHDMATFSKLKDKIKIFPRIPDQKSLAEIISYTDCGVYISRAEGWNLDLLETMAMNKPVIVTNFSAHTEFCNTNNSFLIDVDDVEPAIDNKWFDGTGNWAKITRQQEDSIIDHMRYLYKNNIRSNPEGVNTAKKFNWNNSAQEILRCIKS